MPAGRLAELTGLTTGAVTGIVDRLEKTRYAKRTNDPNDRRRTICRTNQKQEIGYED
jgi:DNA-binding MarR family transcriptional regulator